MDPLARTHTPVKLRLDNLSQLPAGVKTPRYRREDLTPGIVHIGLGNFHRAHQAWYIHRLMQQGLALDWAIIGAGVRSYDAELRAKLIQQDCLTTLVELDPAALSAEVIGPMIDYVPIEPSNGPLIERMSDPAIRIVSLTITEGGYYLDAKTGVFDTEHDDIRHDAQNPAQPRTVFGAVVAALKRRRAAGHAPFTALSCDNLQGNGAILRDCVVRLARLSDPELAEWIDQTGAFPNSMVDCIVPATSDDLRSQCQALGITDAAPVSHEDFRQWVIEDDFCAGRPPLETLGVAITKDVHAYEALKLRILNGGHQILANAGEVLNLPTISDCLQDADLSAFFRKVQIEEILPHIKGVPETSPDAYLKQVERRFLNPTIRDSTRRVAFDGSARHPGFLFPSLRDAISSGASLSGLALAEAFWCRMCAGAREDGSTIAPNDPIWPDLQAAARAARANPAQWLGVANLYGEIGQDPRFAQAFVDWLDCIWQEGSRAAIARYVRS